jgi:hypothetical protein
MKPPSIFSRITSPTGTAIAITFLSVYHIAWFLRYGQVYAAFWVIMAVTWCWIWRRTIKLVDRVKSVALQLADELDDRPSSRAAQMSVESLLRLADNFKRECNELRAKLDRAVRALERNGFEDKGGQEWKPPVNRAATKLHQVEAERDELLTFAKAWQDWTSNNVAGWNSITLDELASKAIAAAERKEPS